MESGRSGRTRPSLSFFCFRFQLIMRRRRKRRHVESGPAELATAVWVVVVRTAMEKGSGVVTDLLWMASQWEADTCLSSE